jgi:hypothetical protein
MSSSLSLRRCGIIPGRTSSEPDRRRARLLRDVTRRLTIAS